MSKRVLLIGTGPLPSSDPEQLGFPQLRTEHFYRLPRTAALKEDRRLRLRASCPCKFITCLLSSWCS